MRRILVGIVLAVGLVGPSLGVFGPVVRCVAGDGRIYHFRIKTSSGNILNVGYYAKSCDEAKYKLEQQYPGCVILDSDC